MIKSVFVGVQRGSPACMAFLFTPEGTKVLFGDHYAIAEHARTMPTCHGIVHSYAMAGIHKYWMLFGPATNLELLRVDSKAKRGHTRVTLKKLKVWPKRSCYMLHDGSKVIRIWRKLPSRYLNELANIG